MKIITICASLSFYKDILPIEKELTELGFKVLTPRTYKIMKKTGDFSEASYRHLDMEDTKTDLIRLHLRKVKQADAILVLNGEKNGYKGYIGGNVLIEMGVAFFLKKKIFVLNEVDDKLSLKSEVVGMNSIILKGNLNSIANSLHPHNHR